jgi:hypothetical protein
VLGLLAAVLLTLGWLACSHYPASGNGTREAGFPATTNAPRRAAGVAFGQSAKDAATGAEIQTDALEALAATADTEGPRETPPQPAADRKIVYEGRLGVTVPNVEQALAAIDAIINENGGYVQQANLSGVLFRVPPGRFRPALEAVEQLGEVTRREIGAEDVTEQFTDIKLRIEVAEGSRKRLMALLDSAREIKDVLAVEKDIRRLTEEIEQMEGALRAMTHKTDWATIGVELTARIVDQAQRAYRQLPANRFGWINAVGLDGVLAQVGSQARLRGEVSAGRILFGRRFRLGVEGNTLVPAQFVPLYYDGRVLLAATAEDHRLRVQALPTHQESDLDFWAKALREELIRIRGYDVEEPAKAELTQKGLECRRLKARSVFGGEPWLYDIWLVRHPGREKELLAIEFARTPKGDETYRASIEQAVKGLGYGRRIF